MPHLDGDRVRAALALRRLHISTLANRLDVSPPYIHMQLASSRPVTPKLAALLRELLGQAGWKFITCETDALIASTAPQL
jgi:hypothetical protein